MRNYKGQTIGVGLIEVRRLYFKMLGQSFTSFTTVRTAGNLLDSLMVTARAAVMNRDGDMARF